MRKPTLASVILLLLCATVSPGAAEITDLDRQRLVAHLEMTASWLVDEVSNLSQTQLDFRRAPGTWTILEVIEQSAGGATRFRQLTFERGTIRDARFTPDGLSVVYSAAWDGNPLRIFMVRTDSPESCR